MVCTRWMLVYVETTSMLARNTSDDMPAFEFVVPLTSNAGMGITMPIPGNTQPWQQFVSQDLRYHIVFKLVQAVFPSPDLKAMKVKGMGKVVASAQRMGKDMSKPAVR
ncbi:histone acetyltransferase p300-like isoform X2 [Acanthaster planci]|uniref:Histone acetyltransferase p300-like isoform X2 n=1 Tax=Acanthaster planci TaxID=133434 RepID=A0A8B8A0T4_ACAPL|nr:histone acetyltransferase p300-like isoform X2 [Acanthaster planci]